MITYKEANNDYDCLKLIILMCEEIGIDYNEKHIEASLEAGRQLPQYYCAGAYDGSKLVGILGVCNMPEMYNMDRFTASEQFWYVLPKYRKKVNLVEYLEKQINTDKIVFGISNPLLQRHIQRLGYTQEKVLMSKEF